MKLRAFGTRIKGVLTPPHCASLVWGYWDIVLSAHCKRYKKTPITLTLYCYWNIVLSAHCKRVYCRYYMFSSCLFCHADNHYAVLEYVLDMECMVVDSGIENRFHHPTGRNFS